MTVTPNAYNPGDVGPTFSRATMKKELSKIAQALRFSVSDSGAEPRTAQQKAGDVVSVLDFRRNFTDDTSMWQRAYDAVGGGGFGTLLLPARPTVYRVGDVVQASGVGMQGQGWMGTRVQKEAGATYLLSVNPGSGGTANPDDNAVGTWLDGIWFNGLSHLGFNEHHHLLNWNAVSDAMISRCYLSGFEGDGWFLGSSNDGGLERHNCRVALVDSIVDGVNHENRNGVSVIDGTDVWIVRTYFRRCSRPDEPGAIDVEPNAGDLFARTRNINVIDCPFEDITGGVGCVAVQLATTQEHLTTKAAGVRVIGSSFRGCDATAFSFFQNGDKTDASIPNAVLFAENTIEACGRGLTVDGLKGATFRDNTYSGIRAQPLIGATVRCQGITSVRETWVALNAGGAGLGYCNVDRLTLDTTTFQDVVGACIEFGAGTSSAVTLTNATVLTPAGLTTAFVLKDAGHTFTPLTNRQSDNDTAGLPNQFVAAEVRNDLAGQATAARSSVVVTTTSTVQPGDATVIGDATVSAFSVTLPSAVTVPGRVFTVLKRDASGNAVTVARAGSDTINGATTYVLSAQYQRVTLQAVGAAWFILST